MICPNTNSQEWKDLVAVHGERGAYKKWLENGKEIPGVTNMSMGKVGHLIRDLQKNLKYPVITNPDIDVSGRVVTENGETRIEINPNLLQDDTIIHEFGHVYIDLLGGMNNPVIRAGVSRLRGSNLEKELRAKYPDVSQEKFDKELLATAIGLEGVEIWKNNPEKATIIGKWIAAFLRNLKMLIGIDQNIAKELAKDLLQDRISEKSLEGQIEEELYEQRTEDPVAARHKRNAEKALGIITSKVEALKRRIDSKNIGQQKALAELITLQKQMEKNRAEIALAQFVEVANHQTATALKKFNEYLENDSEVSLRTVKYLRDAILAFDPGLLKAIKDDLTKNQEDLKERLNSIQLQQNEAMDAYHTLSKRMVSRDINPDFGKVDAIFERRAEHEFIKQFRDLKGQERKDKLKEFTAQYLEDNAEEIARIKQEKLDTFLTVIEKDISAFDSYVNNPKDMNSDIIREAAEIFDRADYEVQQHTMFMTKKGEKLYKEYTDFVGNKGNQKKLYAPILAKKMEERGGIMVETEEVLPALASKGSPTWQKIKSVNGEYKGTPVEAMYDFLMELAEERDKKLPARYRLKNKLPSINKNVFERTSENGVLKALKEGTLDQFKLRKEDTEFGQLPQDEKAENQRASLDDTVKTLSTQAGEERRVIPIHFRGKMEESDRSYDVLSSMLIDAHQAEDYNAKRKIADTVEVMLELVGNADVYQRSGLLSKLKVGMSGAAQVKEGKSHTYRALESLIENRLYGIRTTGDPRLAKAVSKVKSYVSIINLFANYFSAGANFTQGMAMVFMEGAGSQFYTVKDVMKAEKKYVKDSGNILADNTRMRDTSKTNLLMEMLNARSDFEVLQNEFSKNNAVKRNLNTSAGLALNQAAEHKVQGVGMYAVLNNIKVKDKDGDYINKDGKKVDNRADAMSFDEAYSVGYQNSKTRETISEEDYNKLSESEKKNYISNVLHLDPRVASTERTDDTNTFAVSQVVRRVNRDLFGNYDPKNRSVMERNAIGSLFTHMRGWMIPGIKKRWKGGHALWIRDKQALLGFRTVKSDELRDIDFDYNRETQSLEEGMYISTIRWISGMVQDVNKLKFKVLSENWKDLTMDEKRNIRRTAVEMGMAAAALIVFNVLQAGMEDDDEPDMATLLAGFYSRRLLSELMTYVSPAEWQRTMRSPAVTLSLLESITRAVIQTTTSPLEEYDRGRHKGENKALVKWQKVTPLKAFDRDVETYIQFLKQGY